MNDENKQLPLLGKILSKEASKEEQQQLKEWAAQADCNQQFVNETTRLWEASAAYDSKVTSDKNAAWARLESRLAASTPSKKVRLKALWYTVAAAVLVVGIGLGWLYQQEQASKAGEVQLVLASIVTGEAEKRRIELPDGSTIWLNEHSKLQYERGFETRLVELEGEAFFEVAKRQGQPFEIRTSDTRTTVLGTSFNVRSYPNQATEVAVLTGEVAFEALEVAKGARVLLAATDAAQYQKGKGITQTKANDQNALAWKTERLTFDNQQLSTVLPILERYYGVEIEGSEGLLKCHYTGNFSEAGLEEVLNTIAFTFPTEMTIEKTNDKYVLTGQGCD